MFTLTRKTDYALVALARLAQQSQASGRPLSARQMADQDGLPLPRLTNLLKDLQRAGLVNSTRGSHGGYLLARPPQNITLGSIVDAIEGPVHLTLCCDPAETIRCVRCGIEPVCPVTASMHRVNDRIREYLAGVTLAQLLSPQGYDAPPVTPPQGLRIHPAPGPPAPARVGAGTGTDG